MLLMQIAQATALRIVRPCREAATTQWPNDNSVLMSPALPCCCSNGIAIPGALQGWHGSLPSAGCAWHSRGLYTSSSSTYISLGERLHHLARPGTWHNLAPFHRRPGCTIAWHWGACKGISQCQQSYCMLVPKGRNWRSLENLEEDECACISRIADKKNLWLLV